MDVPHDREERIKFYARLLGRSEEDVESQLTRVDERRAMRAGETPDIFQLASDIAHEHNMTSVELLRRVLELSRKLPTYT